MYQEIATSGFALLAMTEVVVSFSICFDGSVVEPGRRERRPPYSGVPGERHTAPLLRGCGDVYSSFIRSSAYSAPVAAVPSDLTSVVHSSMAFSRRSAASVRQMWRRSMAAALMMEAGLA